MIDLLVRGGVRDNLDGIFAVVPDMAVEHRGGGGARPTMTRPPSDSSRWQLLCK